MSGLLPRIRRRRPAAPKAATEQQTLPAGQAPTPDATTAPPPASPGFRERGRLRRRLRYLRRARELGYRDLGGLIFDLHRFGRDRPDLAAAKLEALTALDQELRSLEVALDDRRAVTELREPGIASCARCGALHSSEANFCPNCGLALAGPAAMGEVGGALAAPPQPPEPAQPPAPAPPDQQATQSFTPPGS
jgi:hypothetical protein